MIRKSMPPKKVPAPRPKLVPPKSGRPINAATLKLSKVR